LILASPHLNLPASIPPVKFAKLQVGAGGAVECGFSCILDHFIAFGGFLQLSIYSEFTSV